MMASFTDIFTLMSLTTLAAAMKMSILLIVSNTWKFCGIDSY